jgi:hypothetical protein
VTRKVVGVFVRFRAASASEFSQASRRWLKVPSPLAEPFVWPLCFARHAKLLLLQPWECQLVWQESTAVCKERQERRKEEVIVSESNVSG